MIQVQCRECGYLKRYSDDQTAELDERAFKCPQCDAPLPRQWSSDPEYAIPDEALHKISALSSKILNTPGVNREVVYALESQVRHFGGTGESVKALGLGYIALGETEKAAEFLSQAVKHSTPDYEVLHSLLKALLELQRFPEVIKIGQMLLDSPEVAAADEDVARIVLAYANVGNVDHAEALMRSRPDLDAGNPVVKKAKRKLKRGLKHAGQRVFHEVKGKFHQLGQLSAFLPVSGTKSTQRSRGTHSRKTVQRSSSSPIPTPQTHEHREASRQTSGKAKPSNALVEYWIFSASSAAPKLEFIRERLLDSLENTEDRSRIIDTFEAYTQSKKLTIDYIFKWDENELFQYPKDLMPHNARGLSQADFTTVNEAKMILRVHLATEDLTDFDHISFTVRFVETVRGLVNGVVQDAVSHVLWGKKEWINRVVHNPLDDLIDAHVQLESIDERGAVWIHSHGMRKFGLPELELEGVPSALAVPGEKLLSMVGTTMLETRRSGAALRFPCPIPKSPFLLIVKPIPPDGEGHFPVGSLKVMPYVSEYDPYSPHTVRHVLKILQARLRPIQPPAVQPRPVQPSPTNGVTNQARISELKRKMLSAHDKAKSEIPLFKRSFEEKQGVPGEVHAVKVGFPAPGGQSEWMWVSLVNWMGDQLEGRLENTPILRKDLAKGTRVQIRVQDIFDWVISSRGQVIKGAYTEKYRN